MTAKVSNKGPQKFVLVSKGEFYDKIKGFSLTNFFCYQIGYAPIGPSIPDEKTIVMLIMEFFGATKSEIDELTTSDCKIQGFFYVWESLVGQRREKKKGYPKFNKVVHSKFIDDDKFDKFVIRANKVLRSHFLEWVKNLPADRQIAVYY